MNKSETLRRLCALMRRVRTEKYHDDVRSDCICTGTPEHEHLSRASVDKAIIEYLEDLVDDDLSNQ